MEKLAIFDFDKTLTVRDTTVIIATYFTLKTKRYLLYVNFLFWGFLYRMKIVSNKRVKNELLRILKGLSREEIYEIVREMYDNRIKYVLRKSIVDEVKKYRERDYKTVLLSAQFDFIVKEVFKRLNFDIYIATRTDFNNLKVNGDVFEGEKKVEAIKLLFDNIDYDNSIAFVDNKSKDYHLQEIVKNMEWVE